MQNAVQTFLTFVTRAQVSAEGRTAVALRSAGQADLEVSGGERRLSVRPRGLL